MIHLDVEMLPTPKRYPVFIAQNLLHEFKFLQTKITGKQLFIVSDNQVASYYLMTLLEAFNDRQCDFICFPAGEFSKSIESVLAIHKKLLEKQYDRNATLLALGGGMIGDLTGFAASTYYRGISFIHIPTTIIAQVDSSIGGKTAVNFANTKNTMGTFYHPELVLMDLNTLRTLSAREFQSGFAEIIKYALLLGGDFLTFLHQFLKKNPHPDPQQLSSAAFDDLACIIKRCCEIKQGFIQGDIEDKKDKRIYLNLGHTIGHALESCTFFKTYLHGEAVSIGLYYAAALSYLKGGISDSEMEQIAELLELANLPSCLPQEKKLSDLLPYLAHDKKRKNGYCRFILLKAIGNPYITYSINEEDLIKADALIKSKL